MEMQMHPMGTGRRTRFHSRLIYPSLDDSRKKYTADISNKPFAVKTKDTFISAQQKRYFAKMASTYFDIILWLQMSAYLKWICVYTQIADHFNEHD